MTRPLPFTRRSTRVEAMRLDDPRDLDCALLWLQAHGVRGSIISDILIVWGPHGVRMPARIGQRLVHHPGSGEFTVWDEGQFVAQHERPGPLAAALYEAARDGAL